MTTAVLSTVVVIIISQNMLLCCRVENHFDQDFRLIKLAETDKWTNRHTDRQTEATDYPDCLHGS